LSKKTERGSLIPLWTDASSPEGKNRRFSEAPVGGTVSKWESTCTTKVPTGRGKSAEIGGMLYEGESIYLQHWQGGKKRITASAKNAFGVSLRNRRGKNPCGRSRAKENGPGVLSESDRESTKIAKAGTRALKRQSKRSRLAGGQHLSREEEGFWTGRACREGGEKKDTQRLVVETTLLRKGAALCTCGGKRDLC